MKEIYKPTERTFWKSEDGQIHGITEPGQVTTSGRKLIAFNNPYDVVCNFDVYVKDGKDGEQEIKITTNNYTNYDYNDWYLGQQENDNL